MTQVGIISRQRSKKKRIETSIPESDEIQEKVESGPGIEELEAETTPEPIVYSSITESERNSVILGITEIQTDPEIVERIKATSGRLGQFYPVLKDSRGNVLAGHNRLEADPNWESKTLPFEPESEEARLVPLVENLARKTVTEEGRKKFVNEWAKLYYEKGIRPGKIGQAVAEVTGLSLSYVLDRLDAKYKDGEKAKRRIGKRKADPFKSIRSFKSILPKRVYRWLDEYSRSTNQNPVDVVIAALEQFAKVNPPTQSTGV
jgi:hypothetical protein